MFEKMVKRIGSIVAVLCAIAPLAGCTSTGTHESEWLPSISEPIKFEPGVPRHIPVPGITNSPAVWVRKLDLDGDGKEDSVVTVQAPPEFGHYCINYKSVTYVFRGAENGGLCSYRTAIPWFSVVTHEEQMNVRHGNTQTRRLFSLSKAKGLWIVTVKEYEYGTNDGDAGDRVMSPRKTTTTSIPIHELPKKGLYFISTFRAESDR